MKLVSINSNGLNLRSIALSIGILLLSAVCGLAQIDKAGSSAAPSALTSSELGKPIAGEALPLPALTTTNISLRQPDGLILSTGNMYFTSHDAAGAAVWRTSQTSIPGQESVLYWEQGARFGDIVFAQIDGNFFGYFFAKKSGVITIRRISLTGGTATVIATVSNLNVEDRRNLVTDGKFLYWQDRTAIRKMPVRGGAVSVLDRTPPTNPTAGIAVNVDRIIYATGVDIRFVPADGSAITSPEVRTIVHASGPVTALFAVSNGVYWGEVNGAVRLKVGSITKTLRTTPGVIPTSISTNGFTAGAFEAWTQCNALTCQLASEFSGSSSMPVGAGALGISVTSAGHVFWGDATGVHRIF